MAAHAGSSANAVGCAAAGATADHNTSDKKAAQGAAFEAGIDLRLTVVFMGWVFGWVEAPEHFDPESLEAQKKDSNVPSL